jgi:hypothetical protein
MRPEHRIGDRSGRNSLRQWHIAFAETAETGDRRNVNQVYFVGIVGLVLLRATLQVSRFGFIENASRQG